MDESIKPDPSKRWCPKCLLNTDYKQVTKTKFFGGPGTWYVCLVCDHEGMEYPETWVSRQRTFGRLVYVFLTLSMLATIGIFVADDKKGAKVFALIFGFFVIYFTVLKLWFKRKWNNWLKWAKENGYTEE